MAAPFLAGLELSGSVFRLEEFVHLVAVFASQMMMVRVETIAKIQVRFGVACPPSKGPT